MSSSASDRAGARRALEQTIRTASLLGVDFVPVSVAPSARSAPAAGRCDESPDEPAGPASAGEAAAGSSGDRESRQAALDALRERHDRTCPHCTVVKGHTRTVFGEGDPCAGLMFIGEAPGAEEDRTGRPFVGAAGKKLDDMIRAMGLRREEVYIANVLKARPPNNATPTPEEAERCGVFLREQVRIIAPRVIVTLGRPATHYLLDTRDSMSSLRGRWFEYDGVPVMPTFHPAYLLRAYTVENRQKVWSDLQLALGRLGGG